MGLPLCRSLGQGLWEVRSSLPSKREARVFFGFHEETLLALHAIIKKTRGTPKDDLTLARTTIEGIAVMAKKNPHLGSSFESWLDEEGLREETTVAAIKAVIALQLATEMKKKRITKTRMAELMKTSRAQVDRLLDPGQWQRHDRDLAARRAHCWPRTADATGVMALRDGYISAMWVAGIMQGLMWRAYTDQGFLEYSFVETTEAMHPMYIIRALGGALFLAGALIMVFNIYKTLASQSIAEASSPDAPRLAGLAPGRVRIN